MSQPAGALDAGPDRVGVLVDARLTAADMKRIFDLKDAAFYKWLAMGRFDAFEIKPRIGRRLWSAKKVRAYLDGEGAPAKAKPAAWQFKAAALRQRS